MRYEKQPYEDRIEYLQRYAAEDWLMLMIVVGAANSVLGAHATKPEIADMTMRMAADLIASGSPPGDLEKHGFVPWPGTADEQLARLRQELHDMVARDELPDPDDICWFSRPD